MVETIISYLNAKLEGTGYFHSLYCLVEKKKEPREEGDFVYPATYVGGGDLELVEFDSAGFAYFRKNGDFGQSVVANDLGQKQLYSIDLPFRLVAMVRRQDVVTDDSYSPDRLARELASVLTFRNGDLRTFLQASRVTVTSGSWTTNPEQIWTDETDGTGRIEPDYSRAFIAMDVTVNVLADEGCIRSACTDEPDILRLFNFCDPTVVARLTDTQVACLEAALCEPCADATVTVNTSPFGTAPSGGSLNVPVVNGGDNPVGSKQGSEWVIGNNSTFINATQVTDQEAEVDANIFVTLNGTQTGTWNAGIQTWEVTSAAPTLSVSVSNANPQVGTSITITATPTGFTPTNYLFFAKQNGSIEYIGQNALGAISWTVSVFGAFDIYVQADNNVAASAFNIGGESITSFVTITANVLYVNASDPNSYAGSGTAWNDLSVSNNDVTLVNGVTWDGQSMLFNGTNQYAQAVDSASLDIVGAISITVWIKSTDITDGGIISKSDNANKYFGGSSVKVYEIGRFGNQVYLQLSSGITTSALILSIAQTAAIYNGAWNSITFTWDGTTTANGIKYYLNGVLTAQATAAITSIQSLASTLNIMGAGSYFTQGRIGAVLLNNSALSLAQITANYNSLRAIFP